MAELDQTNNGDVRPTWVARMLKFLVLSPVIGGCIGGMTGVVFVIVNSAIDPLSVSWGGTEPDPAGMAVLFFLSWGLAGVAGGLIVGVFGAIVITIRR